MSESLQYWARTAEQLAVDYVDELGQRASCGLIAITLARLHYQEGRAPRIKYLQSPNTTSVKQLFESELVPRPYHGRKKWGYHIICDVEGTWYDPMLSTPTAYDDYAPLAFGEERVSVVKDRLWLPPQTETSS